MVVEKFKINVKQPVLKDLTRRLDTTRWPDEIADAGWEFGTNLAYLKSFVAYWRDSYDWKKIRARSASTIPNASLASI